MEQKRDMPRVSVLTPVYNGERYLRAAMESVLGQTMGDFEFLLIDDGSKDGTVAVMRELAERDGRVVWKSRGNKGVSATRNELVGMARAPMLAWVDADDVALPGWLERMCDWMDGHAEIAAAGCFVEMMDSEGMLICRWSCPTEHEKIDAGHMQGGTKSIQFPSSVMRKEMVLRAGGFDEKLRGGEDLDLFLRMAEIGRLACVPEVLYRYRQHLASMCQSMKGEIWEDVRTVLLTTRARRGLPVEEPGHKKNSTAPAEIHRRWAWWALGDNNVGTARKHAHLALVLEPFSRESWRTVACAWRGH